MVLSIIRMQRKCLKSTYDWINFTGQSVTAVKTLFHISCAPWSLTALYCTLQHCLGQHNSAPCPLTLTLHCIVQSAWGKVLWSTLQYIAPNYITTHCSTSHPIALQCTAVQCTTLLYSTLQSSTPLCSTSILYTVVHCIILQRTTVYCRVLQYCSTAAQQRNHAYLLCTVLLCVLWLWIPQVCHSIY